jgi:hypothetical protein
MLLPGTRFSKAKSSDLDAAADHGFLVLRLGRDLPGAADTRAHNIQGVRRHEESQIVMPGLVPGIHVLF